MRSACWRVCRVTWLATKDSVFCVCDRIFYVAGECVSDVALLLAAAFSAGFVDAAVGGGGLIQIPALFLFMPGISPATLLGTNKLAGIFGTCAAAVSYSRRIKFRWNVALPATLAAFALAFAGAYSVTLVDGAVVRKALPFILIAVAVYTFKKKGFGQLSTPRYAGSKERCLALGTGGLIGFYDGFFGPGTGSFLIFSFVRIFGFDFLSASATAKVVNVACNLAALLWFWRSGHVLWQLGLSMAVFNVLGSLLGSRLAIARGSEFVRKLFLTVVGVLILKTGYDAFMV